MPSPSVFEKGPAPEPMPAELAARVTAFARACKAAARSVALYPGEHPAVASALEAVTAAAGVSNARGLLQFSVLPDGLAVDGRVMARQDAAVSDLAALLHRHQVGQLTIDPRSDAEVWRRFLALLAIPPDQARMRGGIGKLWASEGEPRIEVRALDYSELLRARLEGDKATWEAIVAACLEGTAFSLDDGMVELLLGLVADPEAIDRVLEAVGARLPAGDPERQAPAIVARLLHAVAQYVASSAPEQAERVMAALADAVTRIPPETLGPMIDGRRAAAHPDLARFIDGLRGRVDDGAIARYIATEVRGGRGTSRRLADAFCGLAPDPGRRASILALARDNVQAAGEGANAALAHAWRQSEELLLAYSDEKFVSDEYGTELSRAGARAVELEKDHTDPPDLLAAWSGTVSDVSLRLLDAALVADLMQLQPTIAGWRELATLAMQRVNLLLVVGDFPAAARLAEAFRAQADGHADPAVKAAAAEALQELLTQATMRHVASHLDTSDRAVVDAAQRFCLALGTVAIGQLAEVLSREERSRPRQHLIDVLIGFGASGRHAVERLRQSPNAAVRRTAVLLLREFGGQEALPELASLLDDTEPHVQREATRAIAMLGGDSAYDTLTRALARGSERARASILGVLWTLPDEDAEQVLSFVVLHAPYGGALWPLHERLVERLGSLGGRTAVQALSTVLQRRSFRSPFRMAALYRLAIDALARIGTREAIETIESVAELGPRRARAAARARLADGIGRPVTEGRVP